MVLNTLFGENIASPPPAESRSDPDPFALAFRSGVATTSDTSNQSSLLRNDWLTQRIQSQAQLEGATSFSHGEPHVSPLKRKGNPRVLCMGLRRYDIIWHSFHEAYH
jgi:hypothetical protein